MHISSTVRVRSHTLTVDLYLFCWIWHSKVGAIPSVYWHLSGKTYSIGSYIAAYLHWTQLLNYQNDLDEYICWLHSVYSYLHSSCMPGHSHSLHSWVTSRRVGSNPLIGTAIIFFPVDMSLHFTFLLVVCLPHPCTNTRTDTQYMTQTPRTHCTLSHTLSHPPTPTPVLTL